MRVYIHIPFCVSKCPYCAFGSVCDLSFVDEYFKALEIEILTNEILKNSRISSIFFGGGTPSVVKASKYARILEFLKPLCAKNTEITFEANPNSADFIWLNEIKKLGANRISFGAQSFNAKKLEFLGRAHCANDVFKAVYNAKKSGFKNINIDLIYGTKLDNKKLIDFEVENIAKLDISHVSAYSLMLEENTPFFAHKEFQKDSEILAKHAIKGIKALGFKQYEISNFAKKNKECKHNLGYWRGDEYAGFGAFSVGCLKNGKNFTRYYAPKSISEYLKNPFFRKTEILSSDEWRLERVFLGLRSKIGVDEKYIKNVRILEFLLKAKKLTKDGKRVFNTDFLLADEIAKALD